MHIEITQVIVVFVTLLSAVITGIVFPLIRSKVSAARWELMKEFAVAGVQAAEILLGAGNGKKKFEQAKRYIEQQCKRAWNQNQCGCHSGCHRKCVEVTGTG